MAVKCGINYELFNINKDKTIIFLHGWGSNKEVMKVFKDYFDEYKLLFIDMPGFGKSMTDEVWDTHKYAKKIDDFLNQLKIDKYCIIGHSFGGKVAVLLNPKYLVLLSSAGILEPKPFSVRLKIKIFKLLKIFRLSKLKNLFVSNDVKGMSENMYQTFKNVVNEDFSEYFRKCGSEVLVFGAYGDKAVSINSVKKQAELLNTKAILLEGDHYFFLKQPQVVADKIKQFLV